MGDKYAVFSYPLPATKMIDSLILEREKSNHLGLSVGITMTKWPGASEKSVTLIMMSSENESIRGQVKMGCVDSNSLFRPLPLFRVMGSLPCAIFLGFESS